MRRVLRDISAAFALIAAVAGLCASIAASLGESAALTGLGATCAATALLAALLRALGSAAGPAGRLHAAAATFVVWAATPFLSAIAFVFAENATLSQGVWEAASNLSTTGLFFIDPEARSQSMILWRAGLHVVGCALGVAAVSVALNAFRLSRADEPGAYFRAVVADDPLQSARRIAVMSLQVLGFLVLGGVLALGLLGAPVIDAIALASAASTSGFILPVSGEWGGGAALVVIGLLFLMSASSFSSHVDSLREGWRAYAANPDTLWLLLAAAVAAILALVFSDAGIPAAFAAGAGMASGAWTEGVSLEASPFLLTLAAAFAFLGGSRLSSTGGVKIARVRAILRGVRIEAARSAYRDSVAGDTASVQETLAAWTHISAFLLLIGIAALLLAGYGFEAPDALRLAIGATANFGPLVQDLALYERPDAALGWTLSVCMVFGKLEIVLVLAAMRSGFWRR